VKTLIFLTFLLAVSSQIDLAAQGNNKKSKITGIVKDINGNPIVNAIIMIDGNSTNSTTDSGGKYKIRVKNEAKMIGIISFEYGSIEDSIRGRTLIDFKFTGEPKTTGIFEVGRENEYINVGYNSVKRKNLTNSVGTFEFKNKNKTYSTIYDMLREIPGIIMRGNSVYLPGNSNLFGPVGPMIVVNGIPNSDISSIQPSTVESISILRDASAAIYGSMGFGGVILIKTKINLIEK
jgi:TonB-dependent SusC/RagA subfamily outer membrane receptor